jgi:hypothetical protein
LNEKGSRKGEKDERIERQNNKEVLTANDFQRAEGLIVGS